MTETKKSLFERLSEIDVSEHIEKKMNLSYLSWVWAWQTIKRVDSNATKEFQEFDEYDLNNRELTGRKVDYCKTDTGCYVTCTVTIENHAETETLYVMDYKNKAVVNPDQAQINKAKQRCFVKACALQGLGLYIYAGEDFPTTDNEQNNTKKNTYQGRQKENKSTSDNQKPANDKKITDQQTQNIETVINDFARLANQPVKELYSFYLKKYSAKNLSDLNYEDAEQMLKTVSKNFIQRQDKMQKVGN